MKMVLPSTTLQISVAKALEQVRSLHLRNALTLTVKKLELSILNHQLDENAPANDLKELAALGIRGELIFPVPCLIEANPRLLGYYRLLMGFSQKECYNKGSLSRFSSLEAKGIIPPRVRGEIAALCEAFCERASQLINGLGIERVSAALIDDLTLLTLGPQLRGSNNTLIGKLANQAVFEVIQRIVNKAVIKRTETKLELENASGRTVIIAFSADPDISITEKTSPTSTRKIIAIEIKGGTDQSNIWNRLGEAEKSHQSAKQLGFVEFWTIYNVGTLDEKKRGRSRQPLSGFIHFQNYRGVLAMNMKTSRIA